MSCLGEGLNVTVLQGWELFSEKEETVMEESWGLVSEIFSTSPEQMAGGEGSGVSSCRGFSGPTYLRT